MRSVVARLTLCALLAATRGATAQGMSGMDMGEGTPPEKLPPPLVIAGLGNSSIAITTSST